MRSNELRDEELRRKMIPVRLASNVFKSELVQKFLFNSNDGHTGIVTSLVSHIFGAAEREDSSGGIDTSPLAVILADISSRRLAIRRFSKS